jgi:DNA-binding HxlR family transcriptional regulator
MTTAGDQFTGQVLAESHPAELGFAELRRRAPGVSNKMLSQTLQSLGRDGLVTRRVEASVPPRVHYALTSLGLSLDAPLAAVRAWAELHISTIEQNRGRTRTAPAAGGSAPGAPAGRSAG